jgi:hypothetical protein
MHVHTSWRRHKWQLESGDRGSAKYLLSLVYFITIFVLYLLGLFGQMLLHCNRRVSVPRLSTTILCTYFLETLVRPAGLRLGEAKQASFTDNDDYL